MLKEFVIYIEELWLRWVIGVYMSRADTEVRDRAKLIVVDCSRCVSLHLRR